MLIIKFHWRYNRNFVQQNDTGYYAVNSEGFMAMKSESRYLPEPEAFTNSPKLLGIALLTTRLNLGAEKKILYTFEELTPELLSGGVVGLSNKSISKPIYTIIVDDFGEKISWSRGIEQIYFSDF